MSYILEALGKGLKNQPIMNLVLPGNQPLSQAEVALLNESIVAQPYHFANKFRLAIHYADSGADQKADQLFKQLLHDNPRHTEAHLARASMYARNSELDKAIQQLRKAREEDDLYVSDSRILFSMGYCLERRSEQDKACQYYLQACAAQPGFPQIRQRLAACFLSKADYDNAINQYQILKQEHPEDAWNYLFLGQVFMMIGRYDEAEFHFEQALIVEPDNFELQDDQIESLVQSGLIHQAIEKLEQNIARQGDFPDTYVRLADLFSQLGNDEIAVNHYKRALEIHPGFLEAAVKLGTQHLRQKRYFEAACQFNQSIEINDRLIEAYVGLALSHIKLKKSTQAHDMLELAVALEPNTILLFNEMNRLQLKVNCDAENACQCDPPGTTDTIPEMEPENALKQQIRRYERAMHASPNDACLHYYYALLQRSSNNNISKSIEHLQRALAINPSFFKARIKLGLSLYQEGHTEAAFEQFELGFLCDQEYIDLHYKLGVMYCDRIQFALAVEYFEQSQNKSSQSDIEANLTLALKNMNLIDRATAAWRCVCELEPDNQMAWLAQRSLTRIKPFPT